MPLSPLVSGAGAGALAGACCGAAYGALTCCCTLAIGGCIQITGSWIC